MMTMMLAISGGVMWALVAVVITIAVLKHPSVRRKLLARRLYPYTMLLKTRVNSWVVAIFGRKAKIPNDLVVALRSTKLDDMAHLRDAMVELDTLPTIRTGNAALGIDSIFDVATKKIHKIPSPYTHPMQYPTFMLPGVPARTFYDSSEFEFTRILEEQYPVIKAELTDLLSQKGAGFSGYMGEASTRLAGWNTFNFWFFGKKFEENCARCPKTTEILESLPRFEKDHIMFSALNPHARIPPHTGPMNGILRAHLGMVVPNGCYIRVGPDERTWEEGKVMVFDDSFEHEVWNHSDQVRIVLFMNFWHPCFSDQEIRALERFRKAYERNPVAKLHAQNQAAQRAHDLEANRAVNKPRAA